MFVPDGITSAIPDQAADGRAATCPRGRDRQKWIQTKESIFWLIYQDEGEPE